MPTITVSPLFELGQCVITPGVSSVLEESESPAYFLALHASGNWGDMPSEDKTSNDHAVQYGDAMIMSAYETEKGDRIWVITEWDRSVTTILLPEEY